MGTRHAHKIIDRKGVTRVNHYGQWDGGFNNQGIGTLRLLRIFDLDTYQSKLDKMESIPLTSIDELSNFDAPHLSRDMGFNLHGLIPLGEIKEAICFADEELAKNCAYFYTVDFSQGKFIAENHDYKRTFFLDNLPSTMDFLNIGHWIEQNEIV